MWKLRSVLWALLVCSAVVVGAGQGSSGGQRSKWQTLTGVEPLVVARGGFSGLFADSSFNAYSIAVQTSLPTGIVWCDVQLTKDGAGVCLPDIRLDNATDISFLHKNQQKTYIVNGVSMSGYFSIDYTLDDLSLVSLRQGVFSRSNRFDGNSQQILRVEDVAKQIRPPGLWLNIQHDAFFSQHNLSMRSFIISVSRSVVVNYISSPEVNFLRSIVARFRPSPTKLVFRFKGQNDIEPSTNQTYGSLLKNLTFIKTFASGILVPKSYIWPVDSSLYLEPYTSVVLDAHKAGLAVFASDFASDVPFAYNYSYDPVAEYLSFIDNGNFSVDGVLSDFPITPSEAIDCFSHTGKNDTEQVKLLVFSSEGASGDYPGCTDLAYTKAISDGTDVLDCPVQMTQDGVPFCLGSINLLERTTVAQSEYGNLLTSIPELNVENGIFAFNLTWSQIQTLRPQISSPWTNYTLYRNPKFSNAGNFVLLSDFFALAKNASSVSGVLISIENAAYLAEKQGLGVTDAVIDALSKSGYNNQTAKKVMIQSTDSSVLLKFKNTGYELVYQVGENIGGILNSTILEMKKFASSVVISKDSVFPTDVLYTIGQTDVVAKLQAFNLSVYVRLFSNEFPSQAWDFYSDAYVEINTFVQAAFINGVVTDFPATANKYRRNRCLGYKELPPYMSFVLPGGLLQLMAPKDLPPAEAPNPVLSEEDVVEPPLPPVVKGSNGSANEPAAAPTPPNGQPTVVASIFLSSLAVLFAAIMLS